MKQIETSITYNVPHWNYCNDDYIDIDGRVSKPSCRFCIKSSKGYRCALYDEALLFDEAYVSKATKCRRATAGYASNVANQVQAPGPTIAPGALMAQTIDLYVKTLNNLLSQGYPRQIADKAARDYILGK